jgi:hypothetical protein
MKVVDWSDEQRGAMPPYVLLVLDDSDVYCSSFSSVRVFKISTEPETYRVKPLSPQNIAEPSRAPGYKKVREKAVARAKQCFEMTEEQRRAAFGKPASDLSES